MARSYKRDKNGRFSGSGGGSKGAKKTVSDAKAGRILDRASRVGGRADVTSPSKKQQKSKETWRRANAFLTAPAKKAAAKGATITGGQMVRQAIGASKPRKRKG